MAITREQLSPDATCVITGTDGHCFKVGEKVGLVLDDSTNTPRFNSLKTGCDQWVSLDQVSFEDGTYNIKVGDIVLKEDVDTPLLVTVVKDKLALIAHGYWMPLDSYREEISAAYRPAHNKASAAVFDGTQDFSGKDYELVYRRGDEVKEVTLTEVAEAMNVDVRNLRIKE